MTKIFNVLYRRFYLTFGYGQPHQNKYCVIMAKDEEAAHQTAVDAFGLQWANLYTEAKWRMEDGRTQAEFFNLEKIPLPPKWQWGSVSVSISPSMSVSPSPSPSPSPSISPSPSPSPSAEF